ncbi:MAG: DUF983 domain-containing protein [Flavobacteriales bacterium]|mgnify:FL=1|nr:DUF983 domain-containing protein [Flavobacteriales bacterium]
MLAKGTKLYSILKFKCPHCHEGEFFVDRNPYHLQRAGNVLSACPSCKRAFSKEPGFYYGGMYISYGLSVAVFVAVWVSFSALWPDLPLWVTFTTIAVLLITLAPWFYALSKISWANMFYTYKGPAQ